MEFSAEETVQPVFTMRLEIQTATAEAIAIGIQAIIFRLNDRDAKAIKNSDYAI